MPFKSKLSPKIREHMDKMIGVWRVPNPLFYLYSVFEFSDEQIAEMVGVNSQTVSRWRRGYRDPSPRHERRMREICIYLGQYLPSDSHMLKAIKHELSEID